MWERGRKKRVGGEGLLPFSHQARRITNHTWYLKDKQYHDLNNLLAYLLFLL